MRVANRSIEQRPRLRGSEQIGHGGERQVPEIAILDKCGVELPCGGRKIDSAQPEHEVLEGRSGTATFLLAVGDGGVFMIRELFGQLAQLAVDGIDGKRDDIGIVGRNGGIENAGEVADLLERCANPIPLVGPLAVAHGGQIGDEVAPLLRQ